MAAWGEELAGKKLMLTRDGWIRRAWRVDCLPESYRPLSTWSPPKEGRIGGLRWTRFPYSIPASAEADGRAWRIDRYGKARKLRAIDVAGGEVVADFGWDRDDHGRIERDRREPLLLTRTLEDIRGRKWMLRVGDENLLEFSYPHPGMITQMVITVFPAVVDDPDFALLALLACLAIQREERSEGIIPAW